MVALAEAGVIQSRVAFLAYITITGRRADLQSGEFVFTGDQSIASVVNIITRQQQTSPELQVTLLEGWDNADMSDYFVKHDVITANRFAAATQQVPPGYDFLAGVPAEANLQGFLFPDTYRLFVGETGDAIVKTMLDNFAERVTQQMREDLAAQGRSLYDAVILASIIEKEVQTPKDKALVAGIFWRRIANGQRLQSDVTILYAMKHSTPAIDTFDVNMESAYNTYRVNGLPPTPICNPGLDSLAAAIYPTDSEYNFFLTTKQGEVIYSKNFDEHLAAKAQYLQ